MRVRIDEAGRHHEAVRVDLVRAPTGDGPDLGDAATGDGEVAGAPGRAGPVDDVTTADDEVVRHEPSSWKCSRARITGSRGSNYPTGARAGSSRTRVELPPEASRVARGSRGPLRPRAVAVSGGRQSRAPGIPVALHRRSQRTPT